VADISAAELNQEPTARNALSVLWTSRRWLALTLVLAIVALAAVLIAAVLGLLYFGLRRGPSADVGGVVPLNRPAPDFTVQTLDGHTLRLSDLRGRTVVLNVWGSWCVPCQQESIELNRAYGDYQSRNVTFVGIAWNDEEDQVRKFVQKYSVAYPIGLDTDGHIAIDLGITGVPETFLIDSSGQLKEKWVGPITADRLSELLAPLVR
jgi:cytochrome c biogenesis protein CcmG, thiol:disulfide interchange protein DsbE